MRAAAGMCLRHGYGAQGGLPALPLPRSDTDAPSRGLEPGVRAARGSTRLRFSSEVPMKADDDLGDPIHFMNAPANQGVDFYVAHESLKATILTSLLTVWVLVGVFVYLNRYTKRRYFTVWTAAWMFYVVWLTLNLGDLAAEQSPLRMMAEQWCMATAAVFLMWGSFRFLRVRARETVLGLFMAFLFLWSYIAVYQLGRPFPAVVALFALIGLAGIVTAGAFARHRCRRGYIGASMLSLGFFLWGLYFAGFPFAARIPDLLATGFFISAVLQVVHRRLHDHPRAGGSAHDQPGRPRASPLRKNQKQPTAHRRHFNRETIPQSVQPGGRSHHYHRRRQPAHS